MKRRAAATTTKRRPRIAASASVLSLSLSLLLLSCCCRAAVPRTVSTSFASPVFVDRNDARQRRRRRVRPRRCRRRQYRCLVLRSGSGSSRLVVDSPCNAVDSDATPTSSADNNNDNKIPDTARNDVVAAPAATTTASGLLLVVLLLLSSLSTTGIVAVAAPPLPAANSAAVVPPELRHDHRYAATAATTMTATATTSATKAGEELTLFLRDFTKLAPLGGNGNSRAAATPAPKSYNLPLTEIADRLANDLTSGSSGGGYSYIISGDMSDDLFRDDCVFVDPTNRVRGLQRYRSALRILFDPERSSTRLLGPLQVDSDTRTITGRYRCRGFLQLLLWNPYVTSFESDITYYVGEQDGLIYEQSQRWTKSAAEALRETFTPTVFTPPPMSSFVTTMAGQVENEPPAVTRLFEAVNDRRPDEYSQEERLEIDALIDEISASSADAKYDPTLLPGTWRLAYVRPGPTGIKIDRRVPFFPDLPFNDSWQIFGPSTVTNVGELFGPNLFVQVYGTVREVQNRPTTAEQEEQEPIRRQRLRADIEGGDLCVSVGKSSRIPTAAAIADDKKYCVDLPIKGEGLFDSVFLGQRLRIGQNLNGGGPLAVQICM